MNSCRDPGGPCGRWHLQGLSTGALEVVPRAVLVLSLLRVGGRKAHPVSGIRRLQ